jgi:hypothetical protein
MVDLAHDRGEGHSKKAIQVAITMQVSIKKILPEFMSFVKS